MASSLTGKNGSLTSAFAFDGGKTDVQIGNLNRLFVADKASPPPDGLTQMQLGQYYLDATMAEFKRYYIQEVTKNLRSERQAQKQAIDDQAAQDATV